MRPTAAKNLALQQILKRKTGQEVESKKDASPDASWAARAVWATLTSFIFDLPLRVSTKQVSWRSLYWSCSRLECLACTPRLAESASQQWIVWSSLQVQTQLRRRDTIKKDTGGYSRSWKVSVAHKMPGT